jgi:hypothetical protein
MKVISAKRFSECCSDNPKPVVSNVEPSAIQKRPRGPKWVGIFAIALASGFGGAVAEAQQTGKIFRIGYLDSSQ